MKNIKKCLQSFFQNKLLVGIVFGGILLNLAAWIVFAVGLDFDKTALILHYNSFFGIDKIAVNSDERHFLDVFFVPFGGLLVMIINYLLGSFLIFSKTKKVEENILEKNDLAEIPISKLGGYFLFWSGTILQGAILVYAIAIILVNR